jgi:sec-independent protein translocase protein TatB
MFGLGFSELLILAVIGLIIIGPKQLPEVMKGIARFVREISKAREEWMSTVRQDEHIRDLHESVQEVKENIVRPIESIKSRLKSELNLGVGTKDLGEVVDAISETVEHQPSNSENELENDERKI